MKQGKFSIKRTKKPKESFKGGTRRSLREKSNQQELGPSSCGIEIREGVLAHLSGNFVSTACNLSTRKRGIQVLVGVSITEKPGKKKSPVGQREGRKRSRECLHKYKGKGNKVLTLSSSHLGGNLNSLGEEKRFPRRGKE